MNNIFLGSFCRIWQPDDDDDDNDDSNDYVFYTAIKSECVIKIILQAQYHQREVK